LLDLFVNFAIIHKDRATLPSVKQMVLGNKIYRTSLFGMIMASYWITFRNGLWLKFGLLQSRSLF